ncbi:MAG: molybdenum cofactor guanylyltransferase MobA [Alphaproteobacteria bacterium]
MSESPGIIGVVLAGGKSTRFGSAKAIARLGGRTLIEHVIDRATPQVDRLVISANAEIPVSGVAGLPLLPDDVGPSRGPLAGILTAMAWATRSLPHVRWLASFAVDTPFFPLDLVTRLRSAAEDEELPVVPSSGGRVHPTFGLWPLSLQPALQQYFLEAGKGSATDFVRMVASRELVFSMNPFDPFLNINDKDDLAAAAELARESGVTL